jgi:hypothetical protein
VVFRLRDANAATSTRLSASCETPELGICSRMK